MSYRQPIFDDPGGTDTDFLTAAKAWAADSENGTKKTTMVNAYAADLTATFVASGVLVVLHQADGTDVTWCSCATADDAAYTVAALNAWLAGHTLPS